MNGWNPQSWNLYSYTRNNPLKYVDQSGEAVETASTRPQSDTT